MKIAIDISQIVYGTGVSFYTQNLVSNLLSLDNQNEYLLFAGALRQIGEINNFVKTLNGKFSVKTLPLPPVLSELIWNRYHRIPLEKIIGNFDLLHTSDWTEPFTNFNKVTTVHDLAPVLYPGLFPRDSVRNIVRVHTKKLELVKKESKFIITPSLATKNDLVGLGFELDRVRVIPEAVGSNFAKVEDSRVEELKRNYKISGSYVLAVGINARKNTKRIIEAFNRVMAGKDLKLVIIGNDKYSEIKDQRNVRVTGYVPNNLLPVLYSGASALLYPSFYEGFGLPILEAFACGCPVVTSNLSSMKEVAGGAACLVDPDSVDSIVEGLEKVLRGPKAFTDGGYKRAAEFSWMDTAKKTLEIYKEAVKK